jgi:hypothetical protein
MPLTSDAQMLQEKLLNPQRTAFYTHYGDILAGACQQLRDGAEMKKVDGWQTLGLLDHR